MGLSQKISVQWEILQTVSMTEKDELRKAQEEKTPYLYGDLLTVPPERLSIFHQTSGTTGKPVYIPDTYESWQWVVEVWVFPIPNSERSFAPASFSEKGPRQPQKR
jgi:phenylacetate-CoA ligase